VQGVDVDPMCEEAFLTLPNDSFCGCLVKPFLLFYNFVCQKQEGSLMILWMSKLLLSILPNDTFYGLVKPLLFILCATSGDEGDE
jgi:hypothetical protein